jgi:GT2 family glycosyltransferase
MKIAVCVPTLKRYDLLAKLIASLENDSLKPDQYLIMDNGSTLTRSMLPQTFGEVKIYKNAIGNIGVAKSWNFFIYNHPEDIRIICNDDIIFHEDFIKNSVEQFDENAILCPMLANAFSCFILPNKVIQKIGLFDENISPNYGYFEDNDYSRRMMLIGMEIKLSNNTILTHSKSSTLQSFNAIERKEHDKKFQLAQANYIKKWGGVPGKELFNHGKN